MARSIKLNDPVLIENKYSPTSITGNTTRQRQGVIAFIGCVCFADGNDWVGVRLIGDSIGQGKNNGTVNGVCYFSNCGPNDGVFVRRGALITRKLNRFEELSLRREMTGSGNSSCCSGSRGGESESEIESENEDENENESENERSSNKIISGVSAHQSLSPRISMDDDGTLNQSTMSGGSQSRLDEIRKRRLELKFKSLSLSSKSASLSVASRTSLRVPLRSTSPSMGTSSTTMITDNLTAKLECMQDNIEHLTRLNQLKDKEIISLKKSMQDAKQPTTHANNTKETAQSVFARHISHRNGIINRPTSIPKPSTSTKNTAKTTTLTLKLELLQAKQDLSTVASSLKDANQKNSNLTETIATIQSQVATITKELKLCQAALATERLSQTAVHAPRQTRVSTNNQELTSTDQQEMGTIAQCKMSTFTGKFKQSQTALEMKCLSIASTLAKTRVNISTTKQGIISMTKNEVQPNELLRPEKKRRIALGELLLYP